MSTNTITIEEPHQPTPCVDQLLEMAREGLIDPLDLLATTLTWGGETFARDLCDAAGIEWECGDPGTPEAPPAPIDAPRHYYPPESRLADRLAADWAARRTDGPR